MSERQHSVQVDVSGLPDSLPLQHSGLGSMDRGLGKLLQAAHQQRVRQLRRIQQMRKASEQQLQLQQAYEQKQQKEELRAQVQAAERRRACAEKSLNHILVEKRRHEAALVAQERADAVRRAAEEKLHQAAAVAAAQAAEKLQQQLEKRKRSMSAAARRHEIHQRGLVALEERRRALAEKEREAEANLRASLALREEADEQRRQHDLRREAQRQQAQQRAEQDLQQRTRYFQRKQMQREQTMQRRSQETEAVRRAHAEEMRLRQEYIKQRLAIKEQRDAAEVHLLDSKIKQKMNRAVMMEQQRQTLMSEMQRIRKDIARQEQSLKETFDHLAHTGRFELPAELAGLECLPYASPRTSALVAFDAYCLTARPASARLATQPLIPSLPDAARRRRPQSARMTT